MNVPGAAYEERRALRRFREIIAGQQMGSDEKGFKRRICGKVVEKKKW